MKKKILSLGLISSMLLANTVNASNNTDDINVCVNDHGIHGEIVSKFTSKYYGDEISLISSRDADIEIEDIDDFANCDIINYSSGISPLFLTYKTGYELEKSFREYKEEEYLELNEFLNDYDGIIVASAGNYDNDTTYESQFARYKEIAKEKNDTTNIDKLFVIGQIEKHNGKYTHYFAHGDQIDFVVANLGEEIDGKPYYGTSYSAPVVSGLLGKLLEMGIPQNDLRDILGFEDELHWWKGKSYNVLSLDKTMSNAETYLNELTKGN